MYSLLSDLLDPLVLLSFATLSIAAISLWRRRKTVSRSKATIAIVAFAVAWVFSTPLAAHLSLLSLERGFAPIGSRPADVDTIVVLSGSLRYKSAESEKMELENDTLHRCLEAARLYREGPPIKLLVSGGSNNSMPDGETLASAMREFLVSLGIPENMIVVEDRSRTTYENAVESAKMLQQIDARRCLLVTNATHLARAQACFHAQGIETVPAGAYFRATRWSITPQSFLPSAIALQHHRIVLHEWIGTAWYWLQGRI